MKNNLKNIFYRLLLVLIFYSVTRIFFVLNYPSAFVDVNFWDKTLAGLYGVRFDLAVALILNFPLFFYYLLPFPKIINHKYSRKITDLVFILNNCFWLATNLADMEYFKFSGRRSTVDIIWLGQDVSDQSTQLIYYFIHIIALIILTSFAFYKIYKSNIAEKSFEKVHLGKSLISILLLFIFSFAGIRSRIGSRPLKPGNAFIFKKEILGHLALNTPYMVFRNLKPNNLKRVNFFTDQQQLRSLLTSPYNEKLNFRNHNVVIIIMESFAAEYLGHDDGVGYMPFTLSLAQEGLSFSNNFANGRRSIEALPSILASIPSFNDHSFINSIFQSNEFNGIGDILKKYGYHTSFFHGGKNGTMGFDIFSKLAGMDHYYGLFEFPNAQTEDIGYWGIHDGPFFQFFADKLNEITKPFVTAIFSLSSHQPYNIPDSFKPSVPTDYDDVKASLYYSDTALKNFFEKIQNYDWYKKTLFIITADHTSLKFKDSYKNEQGDYLVPLIFFHPEVDLKLYAKDHVTQHIDILPSILDFLGIYNCKRVLLGESVFASTKDVAFNYSAELYRILTDKTIYHFGNKVAEERIPEDKLMKLKAYIQYYNNSMIDNTLHKDGFCFKP